jgi:hypothetical protein
MSTFNFAYFDLGDATPDLASWTKLNESQQIRFKCSVWSYELNSDKTLGHKRSLPRTEQQFFSEAKQLAEFPMSDWAGPEFWFSLGFLRDESRTFAILKISDNNLDRFNAYLEERGSNVVFYLCSVYRSLQAQRMAMGQELEYADAHHLLTGKACDAADVRMTIGIPQNLWPAQHARRGRVIEHEGLKVSLEWFPGSPQL